VVTEHLRSANEAMNALFYAAPTGLNITGFAVTPLGSALFLFALGGVALCIAAVLPDNR
jgi:hypothetical protein